MFAISKIFWMFAEPGNVLVIALTAGLLARRLAPRLAGVVVTLAMTAFLAVAIFPVGAWLALPLEERFPMLGELDAVDGIVVLGGAVSPRISKARGRVSLSENAERMTALVTLARRHPEAKLVFTGGSGDPGDEDAQEAPWAAGLFGDLGLDLDRFVFENESRNTYENAVLTRRLVDPKANERWVLITSARHMPRAVGCFREAGWELIPFPVDFHTTGREGLLGFEVVEGLRMLTLASKEWLGLVSYWAMGLTSELFPGP